MFPREDTLDDLHQELGQAIRARDACERAPLEHRTCDPEWHDRTLAQLNENVRELEREIAVYNAEHAEDGWLTVGYDEYLGGRA